MYKNVALNKKEVEKFFEEGVGFGITYHGENDEGRCVLSAKFKNPEIEKEKNRLIERKFNDNPKEVFRCYQFRFDGVSYSVEKITDKGFFKESYYEPRSEWERSQKKREQEKSQAESSLNSDEKDGKQETNSETSQQKADNKNNDNKNVYYGVGVISLVLLLIGVVAFAIKKKKLK